MPKKHEVICIAASNGKCFIVIVCYRAHSSYPSECSLLSRFKADMFKDLKMGY